MLDWGPGRPGRGTRDCEPSSSAAHLQVGTHHHKINPLSAGRCTWEHRSQLSQRCITNVGHANMTITYWPGLCWGLGARWRGWWAPGPARARATSETPTRSTRPAPLGLGPSTGVIFKVLFWNTLIVFKQCRKKFNQFSAWFESCFPVDLKKDELWS